MTGIVAVAIAIALVALAAVTGAMGARSTPGRSFIAVWPLLIAGGAYIMSRGGTTLWALGIGIAVIVGVLLNAKLAGSAPDADGGRWGAAAGAAVAKAALAVIVGAMALAWFVGIIASLLPATRVNQPLLAIALMSGAVVAAAFRGARVGLARTAMIITIVFGVLILIGGVLAGTPARSLDPIAAVPGPGLAGGVVSLLVILLVAAAFPGLGGSAGTKVNTRGAIIAVIIGTLGLIGVIWVAGGSLQFPSLVMTTVTGYISFAPGWGGGLFAGLVAFVAVVVLAALVSAALDAFHDVPGETFGRLLARRPAALLVIGIFVVLVALSPAGGAWLTVTLAVAAIAALVFARRGGKPAPEPASAQEPAPAAAPAAASSS